MKETEQKMKTKEVDVFVMAIGAGLLEERMQIASQLWDAGIRVGLARQNVGNTLMLC